MVYTPDPTNPALPTTADLAGNMAAEFQALKGYIQSLISQGTNFYNLGNFRNRLKNGAFNIAQRGTSVTIGAGTTAYTLDQWLVNSVGGSCVVTQSNGAPNANDNAIGLAPQSGTTLFSLNSRIESADCADLVLGSWITVSGLYYPGGSTFLPLLALTTPILPNQPNNWSSTVPCAVSQTMNIQSTKLFTVPNGWVYFSNTFQLTADTTPGLMLGIIFSGAPLATTYYFNRVQVEKSLYPTPYDMRPVLQDYMNCQRYYQIGAGAFGQYASAAAQAWYVTVPFVPQLAPFSGDPVVSFTPTSLTNLSGVVVTASGNREFLIQATATAAGSTYFNYNWAASSEL